MYERFYQLRERPFALSPDPEYLYPSRVHQEALSYLRYGLETQAGFVVITGEIGSGKTTLLQTLLRNLDSQTTVGRIVNTMLEPRELLETIMIDFGLDPSGKSKPLLLRDLAQYLVDQRLAGRLVLLVIDEAQNLSLAALEELRMLSNLETEKSKLMQIVLVGQPNLRDKLNAPELEQLRQRITVSYHLPPLDADETLHYINHRLRRAALGAPLEFPPEATAVIHARSRGVPRIINIICDAALVFGYAEERRQIDRDLIVEVLAELESTGVLPAASGEMVTPKVGFPDVTAPRVAAVAGAPATVAADIARPSAGFAETVVTRTASVQAASPTTMTTAVAPSVDVNWPPTPPRSESTLDMRASALDKREELLRQRERELAEQRRVLAEEYRLLRGQRQPVTHAPEAAATSGGRVRVQVHPGQAPFESARPEGFWTWVKRVMLGVASPIEKNYRTNA
jgi:putative secretion ATPase (PEP-CTERM system associated)